MNKEKFMKVVIESGLPNIFIQTATCFVDKPTNAYKVHDDRVHLSSDTFDDVQMSDIDCQLFIKIDDIQNIRPITVYDRKTCKSTDGIKLYYGNFSTLTILGDTK